MPDDDVLGVDAGSLAQSVLALVVLIVFAIAGAGSELGPLYPVLTLFTWLTNMGAFGLVLLMAVTSVAVVGYFRRHPTWYGVWTRTVAPIIGAVCLTLVFAMIVANFTVLIGAQGDAVLGWLLPVIVVLPGIAGVLWAWRLRSGNPAVYAGIGRGGTLDDDTSTLGAVPAGDPT